MAKQRRPKVPGLDEVWVLAMKPARKDVAPTRFLTDSRVWPAEPDTGEPRKARRWADSSGPRHFLLAHPQLRKRYMAFKIFDPAVPAPGQKFALKAV